MTRVRCRVVGRDSHLPASRVASRTRGRPRSMRTLLKGTYPDGLSLSSYPETVAGKLRGGQAPSGQRAGCLRRGVGGISAEQRNSRSQRRRSVMREGWSGRKPSRYTAGSPSGEVLAVIRVAAVSLAQSIVKNDVHGGSQVQGVTAGDLNEAVTCRASVSTQATVLWPEYVDCVFGMLELDQRFSPVGDLYRDGDGDLRSEEQPYRTSDGGETHVTLIVSISELPGQPLVAIKQNPFSGPVQTGYGKGCAGPEDCPHVLGKLWVFEQNADHLEPLDLKRLSLNLLEFGVDERLAVGLADMARGLAPTHGVVVTQNPGRLFGTAFDLADTSLFHALILPLPVAA